MPRLDGRTSKGIRSAVQRPFLDASPGGLILASAKIWGVSLTVVRALAAMAALPDPPFGA